MNQTSITIDDDHSNLTTRQEIAERAIKVKQKNSDFDIREFPVSVIVEKYMKEIPEIGNKTEMFMPDYQREYKWSLKQQSEFIESIMIDLPVPYVYVADVADGENEGRIEIIDGSQRIRTLARFLSNALTLEGLELIPELNGFHFEDLTGSRQLRFKRKTIRFIELMDVDEEARRQIFYRLNSGGVKLNDMEIRFGTSDGAFLDFIKELADNEKFKRLCPISPSRVKNREYEEMILRFFAYRYDMKSYKKSVNSFLTDFMKKMNDTYHYDDHQQKLSLDKDRFLNDFNTMLDFVDANLAPLYFRKTPQNTSVPRIRFEALAVGISLALDSNETIQYDDIQTWLQSSEFSLLTDSDASNSIPKLKDRTSFVTYKLLGRHWEPTSTAFQRALSGNSPAPFLEQGPDEEEIGVQSELF